LRRALWGVCQTGQKGGKNDLKNRWFLDPKSGKKRAKTELVWLRGSEKPRFFCAKSFHGFSLSTCLLDLPPAGPKCPFLGVFTLPMGVPPIRIVSVYTGAHMEALIALYRRGYPICSIRANYMYAPTLYHYRVYPYNHATLKSLKKGYRGVPKMTPKRGPFWGGVPKIGGLLTIP